MTEPRAAAERHAHTNRLIHEKSPYLLMHAHNPVEWYAWGEEAFERARRESKPIFLSVGYSTCHWCHVMERESFESPEIAAIMNKDFVSIKVDREERPDVDRVYMTFVQASTGSGGWPMSVFLTPDLKPFFGGTYWPPEDRYGRPGFANVLVSIAQAWQNQREKIAGHASEVTAYLQQATNAESRAGGGLGADVLEATARQIKSSYDAQYGGFGGAPKFPRPVVFNFLLRAYARRGDREALEMTLHTLRAIAAGGIHDHLGGGFHRYSVDAVWHVPHFEKMLYDQAQLAVSYTEAFQITHEEFYAAAARDILQYVLRDLHSPEGGFHTAEDADSLIEKGKPEHGEGAFYVWAAAEIEKVLGGDAAAVFGYCYDVEAGGNVPPEQDAQGELQEKNILRVVHSAADAAQHFGKPEAEIAKWLAESRLKLLTARQQRLRPGLDDKVLTAWNGMMISAFARAAQALGEARYLAAAAAASEFIRAKLYDSHAGTLLRRYRAGQAAIGGFLDDYAFLIQGLLDLAEASFNAAHLRWAISLQEKQDELFWDAKQGGYFSTPASDSAILVRMRDSYDGAEPSANSVAAMNLLRLAQLTGRDAWRKKADETFSAFGRQLQHTPETMPHMAAALDFALSTPRQIIIAGTKGAPDTQALLRLVNQRFIPNKILWAVGGAEERRELSRWMPFIENIAPLDGKATAYVCENYVCKLPASDPEEVARLLDGK